MVLFRYFLTHFESVNFFPATDWLQYEEIEDAEERDKKAVANPQTGGEEKDEKMDEDNQLQVDYFMYSVHVVV